MRRLILLVGAFVTILVGFSSYRYTLFSKPPVIENEFGKAIVAPDVDSDWVSESLSSIIQFKTVSADSDHDTSEEFEKQRNYLEKRFPLFHENLEMKSFDDDGFLFRWMPKSGNVFEKEPILLCAHLDVVPVPNEDSWTHPPFSGKIDDGVIWGRGAVDDKNNVISLMSSVEILLREGYIPQKRPIFFAFGLDEELGGVKGAGVIGEYFVQNDIRPIFALDEGGLISSNIMSNLGNTKNLAFVGLSEKAVLEVEVNVTLDIEAHSSMPGMTVESMPSSYISDIVSRVVKKPMKSHTTSYLMTLFLQCLTPHLSPLPRLMLSVASLSQKVMDLIFTAEKKQNAMVRTGISPTFVQSGSTEASHLFSSQGYAKFTIYLHPEDTKEGVEKYFRELVNHDPNVKISVSSLLPVSISEYDCLQYSVLQKTIESVFGGTEKIGVVPILFIAASDLKHYHPTTKYAYNFMPFVFDEDGGDFKLFHGVDERVSCLAMVKATKFYYSLIKNLDSVDF